MKENRKSHRKIHFGKLKIFWKVRNFEYGFFSFVEEIGLINYMHWALKLTKLFSKRTEWN